MNEDNIKKADPGVNPSADLTNVDATTLLEKEVNSITDDEMFNAWYKAWQGQINTFYKNRKRLDADGNLVQMPDIGQIHPK